MYNNCINQRTMHHAYLWYAVWVCDNPDDVIQGQDRVTLELGIDVLALGAAGEQLDKVDVVGEGLRWVVALGLGRHQVDEGLEGRPPIVEQQHLFAHVDQLSGRRGGQQTRNKE